MRGRLEKNKETEAVRLVFIIGIFFSISGVVQSQSECGVTVLNALVSVT